jgi:hypothetical protein
VKAMKKLVLFLFLATLSMKGAYAQAKLGVSSIGILSFKDTVMLESTVNVELFVKNVGDEDYTGPLAVNFTLGNVSFIMKGRENVTDFHPADSHKIKFTIPYTNANIEPGGHIVVVWPTGSLIKTRDTIHKAVWVLDASAVQSINRNKFERVSVYPNPSSGFVYLKPGTADGKPVRASLLDVWGREYAIPLSPGLAMDLSGLAPGVYQIRFDYADGRAAYDKLVITRP